MLRYPEHGGQCHRHGVRRRKGRLRPENFHLRQCRLSARGVRVQSTDGIVEENVERTLDNFAILSTHGTSDSVILDLMLNKEHTPDAE